MYLDIFLIFVIAVSVFLGYRKGFLLEIFSFVGIIVAVLGTKNLTPKFFEFISKSFGKDSKFIYALSYLIVFCVLYTIILIMVYFLKKLGEGSILRTIDKVIGSVVGFFRGSIVAVMLLVFALFFGSYSKKIESFSKNSYAKKYFLEYSAKLEDFFPQEVKKILENFKYEEKIKKYLGDF